MSNKKKGATQKSSLKSPPCNRKPQDVVGRTLGILYVVCAGLNNAEKNFQNLFDVQRAVWYLFLLMIFMKVQYSGFMVGGSFMEINRRPFFVCAFPLQTK